MDCRHIQFCAQENWLESAVERQPCPRKLDLRALQALFQATAFWAQDRSLEDWQIALTHSKPIVTAWDGEQLIGFARATSDGIYRATIWDVVVHPNYQGAGLGRRLVETVLAHPHVSRVERVYLMTTHQQQFYQRIGFEENPSTTMVLFNQLVSQRGLPTTAEVMQA
ncbi:MAG: GNAT family N-acetyltransferase [Pegethrix bostrychoides GSE-TBD4-15B]|uniref:GNAT family N-acetyltransferase n=1 Tax=Pegethrix bostrychoides GSE-TBD4-15B TaxID=2839662 RepID=A0A951U5D7_9CYAN|nr:GNAT family N-acetyltransferase [Pegethrix bostrychoides GSE-TBD4-15B]